MSETHESVNNSKFPAPEQS